MKSNVGHNYFWGIIFILFGLLFFFDTLGWLDIGDVFSNFWPFVLIVIGLYIILKKPSKWGESTGDKNIQTDDEKVNLSTTFGDLSVELTSQSFRGGALATTFGDLKVDAVEMVLAEGTNAFKGSTVFGDIKMSLGKDVAVKIVASNLAGSISLFDRKADGFNQKVAFKSDNYDAAAQKLDMVLSVTFGDIKVW